jgi:hypothetical protein
MRPRTLHRRGFSRRRRSRWRLKLALVLTGALFVGFVVADMRAEAPTPSPAQVATAQTPPTPTTPAPAQVAAEGLGPTVLAAAATAPVTAPPPRPVRARVPIRAPVDDLDGAGARLAPPERAHSPAALAPAETHPAPQPDDVPF